MATLRGNSVRVIGNGVPSSNPNHYLPILYVLNLKEKEE